MSNSGRQPQPRAIGVWRWIGRLLLCQMVVWGAAAAVARSHDAPRLSDIADASHIGLGAAGVLRLFTARLPSGAPPDPDAVVAALIVIHGEPRDANRTLGAGALAASLAGRAADTVVVAPLFQVAAPEDEHCHFHGNPTARPDDALWTCSSWISGGSAGGGGPTSFAALDALAARLVRDWRRLRTITVAGFSAGGQFVQRYVGFARPPAGLRLRYVVADPGTWLYFDPQRPVPLSDGGFTWQPVDAGTVAACPQANRWKYGTDGLPGALGASAGEARAHYAAADIAYLEGALDAGDQRGAFYKILDKSCAAELQGADRLHRGLAYAAYDRRFLAAGHALAIVPGCAHDVTCVLPSAVARRVLFPD